MGGWGRGNKKEGGGEREGGRVGGVVADGEREFSWKQRVVGVGCILGRGLKRDEWLPAPAVTHKICLPPPPSEGGQGEGGHTDPESTLCIILIFFFLFKNDKRYSMFPLTPLFESSLSTEMLPSIFKNESIFDTNVQYNEFFLYFHVLIN